MPIKNPARPLRFVSQSLPFVLAAAIAGCAGGLGQRVTELSRALTGGYNGGETVAVLLPQSGRFAGASDALKAGILAAHGADEQGKRPQLRFYDTEGGQPATALVRQAAADGASYVIGPLQKQAVEELARAAALPAPVLALNRVSSAGKSPANLYQFSLSPEDEAGEAAQKAWDAGHRSALLLYPDSPWGNRMARGFRQQWAALGGQLAASEIYDIGDSNFSRPIDNLTTRAAGADCLFLVATSESARRIAPQLRATSSLGLPVYTTSHIYSGRFAPQTDQALVGLYFVDIPWLVAPDPNDNLSRDSLKRSIPGMQDSYTRLYAMGIDAYRLAPRLSWLASGRGALVEGKTGLLRLDSGRNIVRQLTLAQMNPSGPTISTTDVTSWLYGNNRQEIGPLLAGGVPNDFASVHR
jgi:outer membrane PBP1 activator LpoA protein